MVKPWTSKNKKWRIAVEEVYWDKARPYVVGRIRDRAWGKWTWFRARQNPVGHFSVQYGLKYYAELPAYIEKRIIDLSKLAIIRAKKQDGFGCSRCRPYWR